MVLKRRLCDDFRYGFGPRAKCDGGHRLCGKGKIEFPSSDLPRVFSQ
jgi:hypothetical protein